MINKGQQKTKIRHVSRLLYYIAQLGNKDQFTIELLCDVISIKQFCDEMKKMVSFQTIETVNKVHIISFKKKNVVKYIFKTA